MHLLLKMKPGADAIWYSTRNNLQDNKGVTMIENLVIRAETPSDYIATELMTMRSF